MRAVAQAEHKYRSYLPLISEMAKIAEREMERKDDSSLAEIGANPSAFQIPPWVFEKYQTIGEVGRKNVWDALAAIAQESQQSEDQTGQIFFRSLDRGFKQMGRGIGDFLTGGAQRDAEKTLEDPNASQDDKAETRGLLGKIRFHQDMNNLEAMFLDATPEGIWQESAALAGGMTPTLLSFFSPVSATASAAA